VTWANPSSLDIGMKGVDKLYLVTEAASETELEFNAAQCAGVKHVVRLSVTGAENPFEIFAQWHSNAEAHLRASGMQWTMLRPQHFMSNALIWTVFWVHLFRYKLVQAPQLFWQTQPRATIRQTSASALAFVIEFLIIDGDAAVIHQTEVGL
jgi:hypothetical protein